MSNRKNLLKNELKKFLSAKKNTDSSSKPEILRTISQVDHPGGTYEVIEYGPPSEVEMPL
jgi:hypothetical protein